MSTPQYGIDAMHFALPRLTLPIGELAEARGIETDKLRFGLGLESMAVCDTDEDVVTLAAEAAWNLIQQAGIQAEEIGRIYVGTESSVDAAKPSATYVLGLLEERLEAQFGPRALRHCDAVDMTFACVGGVDALQNSLDWIRASSGRKALVIASDVAKYAPGSGGEYTQGAGAVAMWLTESPRVLTLDTEFAVAIENVGDFFKPRRSFPKSQLLQEAAALLGQTLSDADASALTAQASEGFWATPEDHIEQFLEHPVFDGPYSNDCYVARLSEALDSYQKQSGHLILRDWDAMVFHLPYAYQGRRMWAEIAIQLVDQAERLHEIEASVGQTKEEAGGFKALSKLWSKTPHYKAYVETYIRPGEIASQQIGNMYTASIFMSLLSTLVDSRNQDLNIAGRRIGFLSYGSGSKSKVFSGTIQTDFMHGLDGVRPFNHLENRTEIDFATYEKLHKRSLTQPLTEAKGARLVKIETEGNLYGYRRYAIA